MRFLFNYLISFFSENLNSMRQFKMIDILVSAAMVILFIVLITKRKLDDEYYMAYMSVGAWQLISMFIHLLKKWFVAKTSLRYWYHRLVAYYIPSLWLVAIVLSWFPLENKSGPLLLELIMGTTSTIMALSYIVLCCIEWKQSKPRLLSKLKL